jgi:hypothetical protein
LGVERRERGEQKVQPRVRHLAEPKTFVAARELAVSIFKKNKTTTATEKRVEEGGEEWSIYVVASQRASKHGAQTKLVVISLMSVLSCPAKRMEAVK